MKVPFLLLNLCCLLIFTSGIQAQSNLKSSLWKTHATTVDVSKYFIQEQQNLGLLSTDDMKLVKSVQSTSGWTHHKFQQQYRGLDVLNGVYILHEKDGLINSSNGMIFTDVNLNINPALSLTAAEQLVESSILLELLSKDKISKDNYREFVPLIQNKKLCIADKSYPEVSGEYALVWVFDLDQQSWPPQNDRYVVNAYNGDIISTIPLIHQENIETEVSTKYYGRRNIILDSVASDQYLLRDMTRGKGIFTVDGFDGELYISDNKDDWIKHDIEYESATDVHFGMEKFYDFFLEKFNWKSIDNDNFELRSIVHTRPDASYVNAFWNGREANFGDGNCNDYGPLTTLDVVAHEFTHGLTQNSSGLIYSGESGGLNESMSDIFGKMVEYYAAPKQFSWELGPAFIKNPDASIFRSMSDPNKANNPKYYKGINWFDEVHNTSGVFNFWFYLISDGEKATNEKGVDYDVVAMGRDKSTQIVFLMETGYLTPSSSYQDAVEASIAATIELYGDTGSELVAVLEAWKAVGLGTVVLGERDLKISIIDPIKEGPSLCPIGDFEVTIQIENIGKNTMNKGMSIPLTLNQDGKKVSEGTIVLAKDLATGEIVEFQFKDKVSIEGFGKFRTRVEAVMTIKDDNPVNDKSLTVVNILRSNVMGSDLAMMSILSLRGGICINQDKELTNIAYLALVKNVGCDVIAKDTEIKMDLTVDGVTQAYSVVMPIDLMPGISQFLTVDFDAEITAGELELFITLNNEWDVRDANDNKSFKRFVGQNINESYVEDFSDYEVSEDKNIAFGGGNLTYAKVMLNGNEMLGFSTRRNVIVNQVEDCSMFKRFFNSNQKTGNIRWCVNLEDNLLAPNFEFDMVQFTSTQAAFPSDQGFQSMAVLSVPGDPSFEKQFFYGQNQGEVVHYKVPLAEGFSGNLQMQFFTAYGTVNRLKNEEFDKIDAILLDNIMITDEMVLTNNTGNNTNILVYPNPANEIVNFKIEGYDDLYNVEIRVYDMMGKKIYINNISSKALHQWNTSGIQSGLYLYEINNAGTNIGSGRIVVGK